MNIKLDNLGASPPASSKAVSRSMKANKARNTKPELALRKALTRAGIRGYRLHKKGVPGTPDLAFIGIKLAVFVFGCFWHQCVVCSLPMPKSNVEFWHGKFHRNQERDQRKSQELIGLGWQIVECWEHEIKSDVGECVQRIASELIRIKSLEQAG